MRVASAHERHVARQTCHLCGACYLSPNLYASTRAPKAQEQKRCFFHVTQQYFAPPANKQLHQLSFAVPVFVADWYGSRVGRSRQAVELLVVGNVLEGPRFQGQGSELVVWSFPVGLYGVGARVQTQFLATSWLTRVRAPKASTPNAGSS